MKKFFSKILNALTYPVHSVAFEHVRWVIVICIAVCLILCFTMFEKIPTKVAFFVDNISLVQDKVTIGDGSDISYHGVPKDYLEITKRGDTIKWSVNTAYRHSDTLQYFKISDENPNRIEILNSSRQKIHVKVHSSISDKDSTLEMSLTGEDVWNEWKQFEDQKEILLRHFAVHYQAEHAGYSAKDPYGFMQQKNIRSFFSHSKNDKLYLVILDKETSVVSSEGTFKYAFEGYDTSKNGTKVQFFRVNDHCYLDDNDDSYFQVDGINYVMKASVMLTEWGAGHVMLKHSDKTWDVFFPKAMGYVESLDTLRAMANKTGNFLTLKQGKVSYPSKNDIYLPHLSSQVPNDICSLEFHDDKVFVRNTHKDSTEVKSKWSLAPTLSPIMINTGHGSLQCRIGYIDRPFICGFLLLPASVTFILLLFVLGPFSPVRLPKGTGFTPLCRGTVNRYYWYLSLLIGIAFCYCICKTLIALKLSYTYPYFEKLTGIIPVSTALTLLLFFTIGMVLNTPFIRAVASARYAKMSKKYKQRNGHKRGSSYPYAVVGVMVLLIVIIAYYFFRILDPAVSQSVISSYYPSEIYNPRIWTWMDSAGINDTHRSVVYALLFVEGLIVCIWAVFILPFWDFISVKANQLSRWAGGKFCFLKTINSYWDKYDTTMRKILASFVPKTIRIEKATLTCDDPQEKFVFKVWLGRALGRLPLSIFILFFLVFLLILIVALVKGAFSSLLLLLAIASLVLSVCIFSFKFIYIAFVRTLKTLFSWHLILLIALIIVGKAAGNFGTALITLGVVIGLSSALSSVEFDDPTTPDVQEGVQPLEGLWQMFFITLAYIACAMVADNGYLTNYVGFFACFLSFYFLIKIPGWNNILSIKISNKTVRYISLYFVVLLSVLVFLPSICSNIYNPNKIHYDRMARRLMLFSNFENIQNSGYRYTETDAEFMVVMSHSMQQPYAGDPLSNDLHILHPSVSSGQSPVVLNDLSVPLAFFGSYGTTITTIVFFLLLLSLLCLVLRFSIHSREELEPILYRQMQWRLMAVFMWTGTTIYIYLSYLGHLPFTGRLIPGFGVDAVGEAIETALLLAFMSSLAFKKR